MTSHIMLLQAYPTGAAHYMIVGAEACVTEPSIAAVDYSDLFLKREPCCC